MNRIALSILRSRPLFRTVFLWPYEHRRETRRKRRCVSRDEYEERWARDARSRSISPITKRRRRWMRGSYGNDANSGWVTKLLVRGQLEFKNRQDERRSFRSREERAREIGGSTRRGRKKIEKKPPRREVLIFNSENQRNVFLPEGLGLFPT